MRISVIGAGYVGLVTAVGLSSLGHLVICADKNEERINRLRRGIIPFRENGLDEKLQHHLDQSNISFTHDTGIAVRGSNVLIIAVGTPQAPDGNADLSYLWQAVDEIASNTMEKKTIIVKSTVPPGTCDQIEQSLVSRKIDSLILDVVHNPEFLRQGSAVNDFFNPDRIIIGCKNENSPSLLQNMYFGLQSPFLVYDRSTAELIKYASNAFLALKISFINMLSDLSEKLGADIEQISEGIGMDKRIGSAFLKAGIGYGGSCFPKDIRAMQHFAAIHHIPMPLLYAVEEINAQRPELIVEACKQHFGSLRKRRILLLGLAFKPFTDDIRESPALAVSSLLLEQGVELHAYDPWVQHFPVQNVSCFQDPYQAIEGCEAVVLLTDWPQFRQLNWERICRKIKNGLIFDGRNQFTTNEIMPLINRHAIKYRSIGRPNLGKTAIVQQFNEETLFMLPEENDFTNSGLLKKAAL